MDNLSLSDKHTQILTQGAEVMARRGYHGTGVQEIVDAAGVPKGSFYHYFASKEDFALQALDFLYLPRLERYANALSDPRQPPLARLMHYYQELVAHLAQREQGAYYCFIGTLSFEMAALSGPIGAKVERILESSVGILRSCLEEARAAGLLAENCDCQALAEFIANAWEGSLLRMKVGASMRPLSVFLDQLARLLSHTHAS